MQVVKEAPVPRLCHVIKRQPQDGFGFHLLANKNEPGQYIGKVDAGSVAEATGLRPGDRLIEVNRVNVTQQTHRQVNHQLKYSNRNKTPYSSVAIFVIQIRNQIIKIHVQFY